MGKLLKTALVLACSVFALSTGAHALGLGGSIGFGGGSGTLTYDIPGTQDIDVDAGSFGITFLLETNPLGEETFSYRLNAGLEALSLKDDEDVTAELGGLVFDNTFAFKVAGDSSWKLWLGPQVRLGFYGGETDKEFLGDKIEYSAFAFGIGPVFGGNWASGDNLILGFDTGIRFTGYSGTAEWGGVEEDVEGSTTIFFVNFDIMYDSN